VEVLQILIGEDAFDNSAELNKKIEALEQEVEELKDKMDDLNDTIKTLKEKVKENDTEMERQLSQHRKLELHLRCILEIIYCV
jgi:predicted RNase H-like nuclease (RuvC/YqgF family)